MLLSISSASFADLNYLPSLLSLSHTALHPRLIRAVYHRSGGVGPPSSLSSYGSAWTEISISAGIIIMKALVAEKAVTNWAALRVDPPARALRVSQDPVEIRTTCGAQPGDLCALLIRPPPPPPNCLFLSSASLIVAR